MWFGTFISLCVCVCVCVCVKERERDRERERERDPRERPLLRGVWVHLRPHFVRRAPHFRSCAAAHAHGVHLLQPLLGEHPRLREGELEDRVLRHVAPVDQLLYHVVVRAKGKHLFRTRTFQICMRK